MRRSTLSGRAAAPTGGGAFPGFGVGASQWMAIEAAVADARVRAEQAREQTRGDRPGRGRCVVGGDIVVGILAPRFFFARLTYISPPLRVDTWE